MTPWSRRTPMGRCEPGISRPEPRSERPSLKAHDRWANAVVVAEVNGRALAFSGRRTGRSRLQISAAGGCGDPFIGHIGGVNALDVGVVEGRPVVLSGGDDQTVRIWDLDPSPPGVEPTEAHGDSVPAVAVGHHAGRSIAVTGSRDTTARVWDLRTGQPVGSPLGGHGAEVVAVAIGSESDETVVATATKANVWIRRLGSGNPEPRQLRGHPEAIRALSVTEVDDAEVLVAACDRSIHLWTFALMSRSASRCVATRAGSPRLRPAGSTDMPLPSPREPKGRSVSGTSIRADAWASLWKVIPTGSHALRSARWLNIHSRLRGSSDQTIRLWDLRSQASARRPLTGHGDWVNAVALGQLGHHPVVVSGGDDQTVRVWSATGGEVLSIAIDSPVRALAMLGAQVLIAADAGIMALQLGDGV